MAEWGVTPDYIMQNWTWDLLHLMTRRLADRKTRAAAQGRRPAGAR